MEKTTDINEDLLIILEQISKLAWSPHGTDKPYDPGLLMVLGYVSGQCDKAIQQYRAGEEVTITRIESNIVV